MLPKTPFNSPDKVCPRELLARYGSNGEVGRQLSMNFNTGMVSESNEQKKERYIELRSKEQNPIVKQWIEEYIGLTDRFGKFLKRLDERDFPEHNEPETL